MLRERFDVAAIGDQLLLTPPSAAFVERVTWEGDVAAAWRPDSNPQSPVRILPDVRFGRPSVKGISTEAIWEHDKSGSDAEEIAETSGSTSAMFAGRWRTRTPSGQRDPRQTRRSSLPPAGRPLVVEPAPPASWSGEVEVRVDGGVVGAGVDGAGHGVVDGPEGAPFAAPDAAAQDAASGADGLQRR
jgi:hypothetical protein